MTRVPEMPVAPDAGVIADARARQRRQWQAALVMLTVALSVAALLGFGGGHGEGPRTARASDSGRPAGALTEQTAPAVSAEALPSSYGFYAIEPYRSGLLLSWTNGNGACAWLVVTLPARNGPLLHASCETPEIAAHPFVPVQFENQTMTTSVRIARPSRDPKRVSYGPVVMRYATVSDTHLEWVYGPGRLWLYDVAVRGGAAAHARAEVVEVSLSDGHVVRTVPMPMLYRPVLAADDDGLWIAPSPETGEAAPAPTYLLAPGATAPRVVHRSGDAAIWLLAAGHTLWEDIRTFRPGMSNPRQELWRLDGPHGTAHALAGIDNLVGNLPALQRVTHALWTLNSVPENGNFIHCTRQQIISINGTDGRQTVVTTLQIPLDPCYPVLSFEAPGGGGQAFTDGAFYYLSSPPTTRATTLYRIRP